MEDAGVTFEAADKGPGSRVNGWELMRKGLKAAHQQPQEKPGITVTEECTHFIRTVPALPRDKLKRNDVDTNAEDHVGDESRYQVAFERGTVSRPPVSGA